MYVGHSFSWTNKGEGESRICSRIDWALGNSAWMLQYGSVVVDYLNNSISDHTPLLVPVISPSVGGGRPFQFFNNLVEHPQFEEVVKNA